MSAQHGCGHSAVERLAPPPQEAADRAKQEARLVVQGMGCRNCVARVYNALVGLSGVGAAEVSLDPPMALVRYDPVRVGPQQLVLAVWEAGVASHHHYRATAL